MIAAEEFHEALVGHLRHAGFSDEKYDVFFERNEIPAEEFAWDEETGEYFSDAETGENEADENGENPPKPYFYVDLQEKREAVDDVYFHRRISVLIELHLIPTEKLETSKAVLWDAGDALALEFHMIFAVSDRRLTIIDSSHRIFSDVLHFRFELDFEDFKPIPRKEDGSPIYEKMEHLDARLTAEGREHAFEAEKEE